MVILITGSTHAGKTLTAQRLLEKYKYPYLSVDHLKMGLIRSGNTGLTPEDDDKLTEYLWPIIKEIIKTAVENEQNLIIEGCYMPFDWKNGIEKRYLENIKYYCLIMTENYIKEHFGDIKKYACAIERRIDDSFLSREKLIAENAANLRMCKKYGCDYILIDNQYNFDIDI